VFTHRKETTMQTGTFDGIVRALGNVSTRRNGFRLLGGAAALGTGLALGGDSLAKRKHRGNVKDAARATAKHKKSCPPCKQRKHGKCKRAKPDGTTCPGGTCQSGQCLPPSPPPPPPPACGTGAPCRVFVTSSLHMGNLGGLAGADAICQQRAQDAGLPGTYKAWLSDRTDSPATRFVHSPDPYQLVSGTTIAASYADLTDGSLAAAIDTTEVGTVIRALAEDIPVAWTHTAPDGTPDPTVSTCFNWTMSAGDGVGGLTYATDGTWTDGTLSLCRFPARLYCFQQS
jgi:hypothetical protein